MRNESLKKINIIAISIVISLISIGLVLSQTTLQESVSDEEEIYNAVLDGNYLSTDSQKQKLVDYLNNNPDKQKEFFEKKDIRLEGSVNV
ncbi:hypothetical protein GF386_04175, partial [Candidatus Pacearchaeota archaeon]|nr:hypothetical protein [Candidatus Pacearchaeota archaeon]